MHYSLPPVGSTPCSYFLFRQEGLCVFQKQVHDGPVNGVHFSPVQPNLLGTGAGTADVLIWDVGQAAPQTVRSARSTRLVDVTDLRWNPQVNRILATSSSNGSVAVWDVSSGKEVIQFTLPNKCAVSAIAWNPAVPTQILTASSDDSMPVVLSWDLRNAHSPDKTLGGANGVGHSRGILSMDWCEKDPDLLLTTAKDNFGLFWNVFHGTPVGHLPATTNWMFDASFAKRDPDLVASCSFDGRITCHSLQALYSLHQSKLTTGQQKPAASPKEGAEIRHIPRWLKRSVGASFSFSGKMLSFSSKVAKSTVFVKALSASRNASSIFLGLEKALASGQYLLWCKERSGDLKVASKQFPVESFWALLGAILEDGPSGKDRLLKLLGLAKDELNSRLRSLSFSESSSGGASPLEAVPSPALSEDSSFKGNNAPADSPILPHSDAEFTSFIRQSIIVGDFNAAVDYCRHSDKWADALVLARCGGQELYDRTQQRFISRFLKASPHLALAKDILSGDFSAFVQQSDLNLWQETVAALTSFTTPDDFRKLVQSLGNRLRESQDFFGAACCFICAKDLFGFIASFVKVIPTVTVTEYIPFVMILNSLSGNALFTPNSGGTAYEADRYLAIIKCLEYAEEAHKEGFVNVAFRYAQLSEECRQKESQSTIEFRYRLYSLMNCTQLLKKLQLPYSFVSIQVASSSFQGQLGKQHPTTNQYNQHPQPPPLNSSNFFQPPVMPSLAAAPPMMAPQSSEMNVKFPTAFQMSAQPPMTMQPQMTAQSSIPTIPTIPQMPVMPQVQQTPMVPVVPAMTMLPPTPGIQGMPIMPANANFMAATVSQHQPMISATPPQINLQPPSIIATQSSMAPMHPYMTPRQPTMATQPPLASHQPQIITPQPLMNPQLQQQPSVPQPGGFLPSSTPQPTVRHQLPIDPSPHQLYQPTTFPSPPNQFKRDATLPTPGVKPEQWNDAPTVERRFTPTSNTSTSSFMPPPPQQQQSRQRFPLTEVSRISPENVPIYSCLSSLQQQFESTATPDKRVIIEDNQKRLSVLYDKLINNDPITPAILSDLRDLCAAIQKRDFAQSNALIMRLLNNHYEEAGTWMVAVKRINK